MAKVKLTVKQRSELTAILPKTGNLDQVTKYQGWIKSLELNQKELDYEANLLKIHDKAKGNDAINKWINTPEEIEISDELFAYIKDYYQKRNENNALDVTEDMELVKLFLK